MAESIDNLAFNKRDRAIYVFDLPDGIRGQDSFIKESVGLVKLELAEEIRAGDRAGANMASMAYNMAKIALVEIDGRPLNKADGEDDRVFDKCDPQIRQLIMEAHAELSTPMVGASKKFLASRRMKV